MTRKDYYEKTTKNEIYDEEGIKCAQSCLDSSYICQARCEECWNEEYKENSNSYPQAKESDEYRYIDPRWLDEIAVGLTAGAEKYGEGNWKSIPTEEHAARAIRHLNKYRAGDRSENHLVNASMRCMMAFVMDREIPIVGFVERILCDFIEQVKYCGGFGCDTKMILLLEKAKENIMEEWEVPNE